jgi:prolyl-tRNA editing enzyme YbaK/EbsC (Cys-tRNA(Pro) deacylase)
MSQQLPEGAQRVQQFLTAQGSQSKVCLLPDTTATAQDAAKALNVPVSLIGKSIVFGSDRGVVVAVVCGDQRVDTNSLAQAVQVAALKSLRADEVKRYTGYVIGGVSPFNLPSGIEIVIDSHLRNFPACYVAAGHPKAVVQISLDELVAITSAVVSPIAIPTEQVS